MYNQRRYALRLLRLPADHPVVRRCPQGFHPSGTLEDSPEGSTSSTSLLHILSSISQWITPRTKLEEAATNDNSIPPLGNIDLVTATQEKSIAAQCHKELINSLQAAQRNHKVAYSDGSRLEGL